MRYQLNESKMFADISEGMAIIINSITGAYYGMNGLGTEIIQSVLNGSSDEEILAALASIPGAPENVAELYKTFIDKVLAFEIMVPAADGQPCPATIDPATAAADAFEPDCNEYKDVQELLFADPIHEVDAEEGWKPE